jgi:acyl-CoA carboxylase subunit beta
LVEARTARERLNWTVCRGCRALVYQKRLTRNLGVCPQCGRHGPLPAPQRLGQLLDGGGQSLGLPVLTGDPLGFVDTVAYPERLARARAATGLDEAVVCARGAIDGQPVIAAIMDFRFMGGSLGSAVGELIAGAAETALRERVPLLIASASGGARMQEGAISLMQLVKTSQALAQLDEAGILTISLVTDPTYGGVAASYATLCDVILAEPGARLGFAGPRVIEQTIGQRLPAGFQTAEFLLEHGLIDGIRRRLALPHTLSRLLGLQHATATPRSLAAEPANDEVPVIQDPDLLPDQDVWEVVGRARHLDRPTTVDYLRLAFDDFEELRGDRLSGDCPAIVGGVAWLGQLPLIVVGHQKGHTTAGRTASNFGMPKPSGYRKAARLMRLAAKLGLPVVTLVDTPGAYPGVEAEEQGQAVAIAESVQLMASLPVPIVTVVTGEGGSGGALALAVADRVLMFSNSIYSVISPEGCAAILWNEPAAARRAAAALRLDARELLRLGIVDGVVPEPAEGAHACHQAAARQLRAAVVWALRELLPYDGHRLVAQRRARYRRYGVDVAAELPA